MTLIYFNFDQVLSQVDPSLSYVCCEIYVMFNFACSDLLVTMTVDESPVSPPNAAPTTPKPTLAKKQSQTEQV